MTETTDMAVRILQETRDGNDLHPSDLCLLQYAVNDDLNEAGIERFEELHSVVEKGEYNIDERWKT